ncbi:MAG TPA: tetratricopeptide repeat protein [Caulobacteraceae bacterium]|nr:tetratricopeptide repeat protein [Caulobacteraceae bacterium]
MAAHRAGQLAQACAIYQSILAQSPDDFDALHMLGLAVVQAGDPAQGARLIEQAITREPGVAAAHVNLSMAQEALGRFGEALASADRAIALGDATPDAYLNRGNALLALGCAQEALAAYEHAVALQPGDPRGPYNCARTLRVLGRFEDALAGYDAAIALWPGFYEAVSNRGEVLSHLGRLDEALAAMDAALALRPSAEAHRNRGAMLTRLRRLDEAMAAYDIALGMDPANAQAHGDRANVLNDLGRATEALAAADRALALSPERADPHNSRGVALYSLGRLEPALASYERALALAPEFPEAHMNRALAWLRSGDLAAGFAEYRWRWRHREAERPHILCPEWEGEPLAGKRLVVWAEQGYGDTLQFIRFVPQLVAQGARVTVLVDKPLKPLITASLAGVEVVDWLPGDADFDAQVAMMCLPRLLGVTLRTIPAPIPYLAADPAAAAAWAARLAALPGRKVGLVWAGAARRHNLAAAAVDARRSMRLSQLAALAAAPGVQFVSLQIGEPAAEIVDAPGGLSLVDWTAEIGDFADTAALVAGLDLVITVDTSVAHLAGALGRPVWILSRFDGCWRWLQDRDDTPWYPTARLFRQPAPGAWEPVIASLAEALASG